MEKECLEGGVLNRIQCREVGERYTTPTPCPPSTSLLAESHTSMFRDKTIERRVMMSVRGAITRAQEAFEGECEQIETDRAAAVDAVHEQHNEKTREAEEKAVKSVFENLR